MYVLINCSRHSGGKKALVTASHRGSTLSSTQLNDKIKKKGNVENLFYFVAQPQCDVQCYPKLKLETKQQCPRTQGTTITETSVRVTCVPGVGEVPNDLYDSNNNKKNSGIPTGLSANSIDTCK